MIPVITIVQGVATMEQNMIDRMRTYLEAKADMIGIIQSHFPEYEVDGLVLCPFHNDTKMSLHISPQGKAYCHSCGWSAGGIIDLYAKLNEVPYMQARMELYHDTVRGIPDTVVEAHVKALHRICRAKAIEYLMRERVIPMRIIKEFELGYETNSDRITIPIRDQFGVCINIRRMAWLNGKNKCKALNIKGRGECRLFPERLMAKEQRVVLVEGEWDTLVGRARGLPTITWTGGATGWNDDYTWMFKDKVVFILYDNDRAGIEGGQQAYDKLKDVAAHVKIEEPILPGVGKDLTDWCIHSSGNVSAFALSVNHFELPKIEKTKLCPCCGQTIPKEEE